MEFRRTNLSAPIPPSTHYADEIARATAERASQQTYEPPRGGGAPDTFAQVVKQELDTVTDDLHQLSARIHQLAETAFEERESAQAIVELLRAHGIDAQTGVYGVETAVLAEVGDGGRTIGILAEYDALPEIGHACGHNVICATGVGAFLVLARAHAKAQLPGKVVLLGTPAEEGHTGKEYMAREGAFDSLDAAIMLHGYGYDCADQVWLGRRTLTVTYKGVPAHASAQPFMGRNALDAANLFYQGLGLLRQQMPPIDRIHAVIPEGGTRPSIVTEEAQVQVYVRSKFPETLKDLSERVHDVAQGAALMTGTGVEMQWDVHPPSLPIRTNQPLTDRWVKHQNAVGRSPLPAGVLDESIAASTDFGNVSYRVPGIHPLLKISDESVALHTRAFEAASGSESALQGVVDGAYGLAMTAADFLFDDELAASVTADFEAAGGRMDVPNFFN
ncbi:M20 family metallopeptidase [Brevibacterium sp. UMB1308A]|uniref:M20 family metallopeptidase n=1 Tax=Brevibacterium sp. UMB1308A TaxID=3050608 RepID=UPI00254B18DD|nr:M20 family metallopeptidase [Brevibacterium sp. UMB1308A]MDK8347051.1 M20 family metallopeptidase [Brevibacterium sp. UMB1308B]MDK8714275.1 M20 family metallopeptidase [Brevibacterium sp. UMB1308A]